MTERSPVPQSGNIARPYYKHAACFRAKESVRTGCQLSGNPADKGPRSIPGLAKVPAWETILDSSYVPMVRTIAVRLGGFGN